MVVGQLEIQLLANVARLQTQMDQAKSIMSNAVSKFNQILGAVGVGVTFAGIANLVRSVADAGDKINDLRKITGLAAQDLAGLDKVAALNGTSLDQLSKALGIMSKNIASGASAFDTLGIATRNSTGGFRDSKEILLDISGKFEQMEDGVQKAAIAQQLFGKSGRELIPLLNEGKNALSEQIQKYGEASGMTNKLAAESDRFNDTLTELQGRINAVKTTFVGDLLPALNNIIQAMTSSESSTSKFSFAAQVVVPVLKGLAIAGYTVVDTFRGIGREIGARAAQLTAFANLDFSGAKFIGQALAEDNKKSRAEYDKFVETVINADKSVQQYTETQKRSLVIEAQIPIAIAKTTKALKEKKELTDAEKLAILRQEESTKSIIDLNQKVESTIQSVATKQEIYNKKLEELNRLKPYLSVETYSRALKKAQDELKNTEIVTENTTDQVSQFWIQASRNIQSSLSSSIFDFFNSGLSGMVSNVKNTVLRIISEFAALKILQSFGGIGGTGSTGGTVSTLAGIASMFGGARNVNSSSYGVFSNEGGAGTAFIGGTGTAIGGSGMGVNATRGTGFGTGSLMSMGAMVGPYGIAAAAAVAVLQALEKKVGDYKLTGGAKFALGAYETFSPMSYVVKGLGLQTPEALIGKFLFGRGPYKFRQQFLEGTASNEGFDGDITNIFRSKGGVFVKNKHLNITDRLTQDQQLIFDEAIGKFYKSTHNFAERLGLDTRLVEGFTKDFKIVSEKGKQLTAEAMQEMFNGLGNDLAKNVLPIVDTFKKAGEDSFATLTRLNDEFIAFENSVMDLGATSSYATNIISKLSIEQRTGIIELAGGVERLSSLTGFFAENFLTEEERFNQANERLQTGLKALGIQSGLTNDQFKAMVQSLDTSVETRIKLLELAPTLLAVNSALVDQKNKTNDVTDSIQKQLQSLELNNSFSLLKNSVEDQRKKITDQYNKEANSISTSINNANESISKLRTLSNSLKSTINDIDPITRDQAKKQIEQVYENAKLGIFTNVSDIQGALNVLGQKSTKGFSSGIVFDIEQAKTKNLLSNLKGVTDKSLSVEERTLIQLEEQQNLLKESFDKDIERLDGILESAQKQIDILNGINTSILSLNTAIGNFNRVISQQGGSTLINPNTGIRPITGNPNITASQIVDYFNSSHSPDEIIRDMKKYGVTTQQIIGTGRFSQKDVDKFFKDNPNLSRESVDGKGYAGLSSLGDDINKTIASILMNVSNSVAKSSVSNEKTARILRSATRGSMTLKTSNQ